MATADNSSAFKDDPPELPFVTTTDILSRLNQNLSSLATDDGFQPRFEMQKRLPDGSTISASQADLAYSDLQNKLQQSAKFVSQLTQEDKAIWAEEQRQVGNAYFAKADYQAAMDIYTTCLVTKEGSSDEASAVFLEDTLLPVLNNLAQCTLQLGMHKKTIEFCEIALEEIKSAETNRDDRIIDSLASCKILYKRAKARRLTGVYSGARDDLNSASEWLQKKQTKDPTMDLSSYQQAIDKEFRLLEIAEANARKNRRRQKLALQKALQSPTTETEHASTISSPSNVRAPRQFSSIRARGKLSEQGSKPRESQSRPELSYCQYYRLVVARVTETLLIWLGDEETIKRAKERID